MSAATDILMETGLPGLNTNAIAARASINVSTLYSYFPDKVAIVRELADRLDDRRDRFLAERLKGLVSEEDWRSYIADMVEGLVQLRVESPGSATLHRVLRAVPETEGLDSAALRRRAILVGQAIGRRNQTVDQDQAELVGRVVSELVARMLDLAFESEPYDRAIVGETILLAQKYLAPCLDTTPSSGQ
ncbi:TetR/AcrR family transcriptional regulator [Streptomyces chartreusis]|uniref:TetR/AcrR family transcriptional regulator n=1 Tax=Streptomyces chartreusis TaxID=1969 RepID=UPI0037F42C2C